MRPFRLALLLAFQLSCCLSFGIAVARWGRRVCMKHTSIRGLSPQAGGFRRRSNTETGIEPSEFLERLPCGQHVVTRPPAALIIPQRATDLKPRIKDSCLNTTHITNTDFHRWVMASCICVNRRHLWIASLGMRWYFLDRITGLYRMD